MGDSVGTIGEVADMIPGDRDSVLGNVSFGKMDFAVEHEAAIVDLVRMVRVNGGVVLYSVTGVSDGRVTWEQFYLEARVSVIRWFLNALNVVGAPRG